MSEKLQNWKLLQSVILETHATNMVKARVIGKEQGFPAIMADGPSINFNSEKISITSGWKSWPRTKGTLLDFIERKRFAGATEVFIQTEYFMMKKKNDIDRLKLNDKGITLFITVWNNIEGFLF